MNHDHNHHDHHGHDRAERAGDVPASAAMREAFARARRALREHLRSAVDSGLDAALAMAASLDDSAAIGRVRAYLHGLFDGREVKLDLADAMTLCNVALEQLGQLDAHAPSDEAVRSAADYEAARAATEHASRQRPHAPIFVSIADLAALRPWPRCFYLPGVDGVGMPPFQIRIPIRHPFAASAFGN